MIRVASQTNILNGLYMRPAFGMDPTYHRQPSWPDSQSTTGLPGLGLNLNILNTQATTAQHQPQPIPSRTNKYEGYFLKVIQEPMVGRVAQGKEKDKKPIDPPTIVELGVRDELDPQKMFLQSPYLICCAFLEPSPPSNPNSKPSADSKSVGTQLSGTTVSSLHRLKDPQNKDGAFFTFGDLVVKREGEYRLRIVLMCMEDTYDSTQGMQAELGGWVAICETRTRPFKIYSNRNFPGMMESTFLTRSFSDQGVRLRLRKDSRTSQKNRRNTDIANRCDNIKNPRPQASSLYTHDEETTSSPYETQAPAKRQRTSGGFSLSQDYAAYSAAGAYANVPAQVLSSQTNPYSPPTTNPNTPSLNSRHGSMTMMPSRTPSFQHHAFPSPPGRHSPGSSYQYNTTPPQYPPHHMYQPSPHANGINLPPMDTQQPLQQTSSIGHSAGTSPRTLTTHTPVSTMGSPTDQAYTTSAGPSHGLAYTVSPYSQQINTFDQGTVRTNGVPTPLTADMPPDGMSASYMAHPSYYMSEASGATAHHGDASRTPPGM